MNLKEFLLNPILTHDLCRYLSFEDAIRLQKLFKLDQKIPCIIQVSDIQDHIYTFRGVNANTIRAYFLIKGKDAEKKFISAAGKGNIEIVQLLLEIGVNVNAIYKNRCYRNGYTALINASREGHTKVVKLLLKRGANINAIDPFGDTALARACRSGREKIVKILLEWGIKVSVDNSLMSSSVQSNINIFRMLLNYGANVDTINIEGWTTLMMVSQNGFTDIARLLLDRGANINIITNAGETALIFASRTGRTDIVKMFIERGANITQQGRIALRYARHYKYCDIIAILESHGIT